MRHVQPNVIIPPIILTQDETTQDGSNRRTLKPMYAQFGNVRVRERTCVRACVCVCVGVRVHVRVRVSSSLLGHLRCPHLKIWSSLQAFSIGPDW